MLVLDRDSQPDVGERPNHRLAFLGHIAQKSVVAAKAGGNKASHEPLASPVGVRYILAHPLWALRQHLEGVLRYQRHHREHKVKEVVSNLLMEQIAHRVYEDAARFLPVQRRVQPLRM